MSDGKWWDLPWNTATGCDKCSPACDNCWVKRQLHWLKHPAEHKVILHPEKLDLPKKNKKPTRYFVCNRSDWMHPDIPDSFILKMLAVMVECPQHTFFTLTKRPERLEDVVALDASAENLWIGVTAWDQDSFLESCHSLGSVVNAGFHTFFSFEPLLAPIDVVSARSIWNYRPDWIVVGGENGPGARPMEPEWVYKVKLDCEELDIPFWFKQWGTATEKIISKREGNYRLPKALPRQRPEGG